MNENDVLSNVEQPQPEVVISPKFVTVNVPATLTMPTYQKLKRWTEANNTTIEKVLSRYLPLF